MDTWNSIFCTTRTRNTQLQDTKMLGGVKRKSEKEREEKECGRQFYFGMNCTCSKAILSKVILLLKNKQFHMLLCYSLNRISDSGYLNTL